jgi:cytochrome P450
VKRHPIAWIPFGFAPRNFIGMRFALMELKMCLIRLLRLYRILPGDKIDKKTLLFNQVRYSLNLKNDHLIVIYIHNFNGFT